MIFIVNMISFWGGVWGLNNYVLYLQIVFALLKKQTKL